RPYEDQAGGDIARNANEAAVLAHDLQEPALVRHAEQRAVAAVAPRVIRADERFLRAARRRLDARAAVATHVQERTDLARVVARDQQRNAARIVGEEVTGIRDLRDVAGQHRQL